MNDTALLWLLGLLVTLQTAALGVIAKVLWEHITQCREVQRSLGQLDALPQEIERIRSHLHDLRNGMLSNKSDALRLADHTQTLEMRVAVLERRRTRHSGET